MHPIQNSGSKAFMEKKFPTARLNSAQSEAAHASAIAHARPPSSRAIAPVRATVAAPASAGSRRIANSESPSRISLSRRSKDRQRRLIDVSKIEMPRASDVVELVAKITVAPVRQQMDQQRYRAEESD